MISVMYPRIHVYKLTLPAHMEAICHTGRPCIYIHVHDLYLDLHHAVFVLLQLQLDPLTALHLDGSPLLLQALQDVLTTGTAAVAERLLQTGGEGQALHSVMCGGREGGKE